jgi:nucleolar protein 4
MASQLKQQLISQSGATATATISGTDGGITSNVQLDDVAKQPRSLFVHSLPLTVTNESLTEHFSQFYPLKHATIVLDPVTKRSKGYGFVTFADADDARRTREEFNNSVLEGRKIKVDMAVPRHRDMENKGPTGHRKSQSSAEALKPKASRENKILASQVPPKLIVRNLPWSIKTPQQLALLFRSYGKVKFPTLPKIKPGLSPGFGFVTLQGRLNAERALASMNGKVVDGRTLAVDWAVEKDVWQISRGAHVDGKPDENESHGNDDSVKLGSESDAIGNILHSDAEINKFLSDKEIFDDDSEDANGDDTESGVDLEDSPHTNDVSCTLFVRNLPFTSSDENLLEHFISFGPVRYARVVTDHYTGRSKGTGFVCFYNFDDSMACLRSAPRLPGTSKTRDKKPSMKHSLLEDTLSDPTSQYTLGGRVLQISPAVNRIEATRLTAQRGPLHNVPDKDKRRLYLLSEGTTPSSSALYSTLAPSEAKMREESAKQRQVLIQRNPSLRLSLTRLAVRNLPRTITSKDLKALAREAVVGFAKDVKEGNRHQLSKEELSRGGEEMREAEKSRKTKGKGIVKQAKIVFEGREGGKVAEGSGAGRSRGYGFIEYSSHRWALMGLRWLNGHPVRRQTSEPDATGTPIAVNNKRLIVEFAIENGQVVARRQAKEVKAREIARAALERRSTEEIPKMGLSKEMLIVADIKNRKRKRGVIAELYDSSGAALEAEENNSTLSEKMIRRHQIIGKKRVMRRARKG